MNLKELIEQATPLPWYLTCGAANEPIIQSAAINEDNFVCISEGDTNDQASANAELIVHAVNMHLRLVEALEMAKKCADDHGGEHFGFGEYAELVSAVLAEANNPEVAK